MIISKTPYRISFFGGGTDYPGWYREHGGAVLAAAIDKYCYLTVRNLPPFFEHRTRVVYSKVEDCRTNDEISHPAVRAILQQLKMESGVEIHCVADLPARSGIGSSSTFCVGLLHAVHSLQGRMPTRKQLALEAIHIEQDVLKETVGSQDQVMAAIGGLRHVSFLTSGEISAQLVPLPPARLREFNRHLMLFYTGIVRTASDVAQTYVADIQSKHRQLKLMSELVEEGMAILTGDDELNRLGGLFHDAWQAKRSLSAKVSNSQVDDLYDAARSAGALGGKLTGAGGGGFLMLFAPPERHDSIRDRLAHLVEVPFRIEPMGSQIIFYENVEGYEDSRTESASPDAHPLRIIRAA